MRPDRSQLGRIAVIGALAAAVTACAPTSAPTHSAESALASASPSAEASAAQSVAVSPAVSVPAGYLDPSVPNWPQSARLPRACRFPVVQAIEEVFERVAIRVEEMTPPDTGSVCQYWYGNVWFGNLHAYPPVASAEDLAAAAGGLRGGDTWSAGTYEDRDYLSSYDYLLVAHERATLWVIVVGLGSPFEDIHRLASAIIEVMDASAVAIYACGENPPGILELHKDGDLTITDASGGFFRGSWSVGGDTMTFTVDGEDSFYLIDGDRLIGEVGCTRMN